MRKSSLVEHTSHTAAVLAVGLVPDTRQSVGGLHSNCRSRLLEFGAVLHMLRQLNRYPDMQDRLANYCHAALKTLDYTADKTRIEIHISRATTSAAFGSAIFRTGELARGALHDYRHLSNVHKRIFFNWLLIELATQHKGEAESPQWSAEISELWAHTWVLATLNAISQASPSVAIEDGSAVKAKSETMLYARLADAGIERHLLCTLVVMLTLHRTGHIRPQQVSGSVYRVVRFVVKQVRDDGGVPIISDEDTWLSALATVVLSSGGVPATELANTADYTAKRQLPGGGWPYTDGARQPRRPQHRHGGAIPGGNARQKCQLYGRTWRTTSARNPRNPSLPQHRLTMGRNALARRHYDINSDTPIRGPPII